MPSLLPLFASIMPFLLWPIELLLPFPYIIEEVAKSTLIFRLLKLSNNFAKIKLTILIGVIFAVSETVLYLFNIYLVGDIKTFALRLIITVPLHVLTSLSILAPALLNRRLIVLGLIFAILLHYIFNLFIAFI